MVRVGTPPWLGPPRDDALDLWKRDDPGSQQGPCSEFHTNKLDTEQSSIGDGLKAPDPECRTGALEDRLARPKRSGDEEKAQGDEPGSDDPPEGRAIGGHAGHMGWIGIQRVGLDVSGNKPPNEPDGIAWVPDSLLGQSRGT